MQASLNTKFDFSARPRSHSNIEAAFSPVNNDGCFDFDRVVKSGYVQKRTQKTKVCTIMGILPLAMSQAYSSCAPDGLSRSNRV